ncbi:MAG: NAD(P)H-dependent oxidoreductase [Nannocystis sp.]|nr:NAD(P)H-dependent oxidoreductase [Nannocystis sp.]
MRIVAISGSLRAASSNAAVLRAVAMLAPADVEVALYEELGELPQFNPDDDDTPGPVVERWRALLRAADGLLVSSPEYAHGVPGSLKNALDWVVGSGELERKPLGLINASPRATHAQASLHETLTIMSATLVPAACVALPVSGRDLDAAGIIADPELAAGLRAALTALIAEISRPPEDA